jgi:CheY-like chemotaxis protein
METAPILFLVEDDALISETIEHALVEGGFKLETANSGDKAIAMLTQGIQFQGLITDINLGAGPKGWEVAKKARELNPDLAVVYMSGDSGHEWPSLGVPNSVFLTKPFAPAQIVTAISTLLNTASPNS